MRTMKHLALLSPLDRPVAAPKAQETPSVPMRTTSQPPIRGSYRGTVKWFDADKGLGIIALDGSSAEFFVHFSAILTEGYRSLEEGQRVAFDIAHSGAGVQAADVQVIQS